MEPEAMEALVALRPFRSNVKEHPRLYPPVWLSHGVRATREPSRAPMFAIRGNVKADDRQYGKPMKSSGPCIPDRGFGTTSICKHALQHEHQRVSQLGQAGSKGIIYGNCNLGSNSEFDEGFVTGKGEDKLMLMCGGQRRWHAKAVVRSGTRA
ncbi:hypothetical protein BC629DRAFT_473091 [Irpex lacteus]|nr:hypothetical protein BC629DRAFT_473091 [Irpex lacteus]